MRSATSSRGRAAISFSRSVSCLRILSTAGRAELSESAVKSASDQWASLTASDSGRRRLPWQTAQSVADMYCVIHSRYESELDSSKLRSRNFRMPGKRKPLSLLDLFSAEPFSPDAPPFVGG